MFVLFVSIYPMIFFKGISMEIKLDSFLQYICHRILFMICLKLSSVLVKLLFWRTYPNFYFLGFMLKDGERYILIPSAIVNSKDFRWQVEPSNFLTPLTSYVFYIIYHPPPSCLYLSSFFLILSFFSKKGVKSF